MLQIMKGLVGFYKNTDLHSQGITVPLEDSEQGSDIILIKQDHGDYCVDTDFFMNKNRKLLEKCR